MLTRTGAKSGYAPVREPRGESSADPSAAARLLSSASRLAASATRRISTPERRLGAALGIAVAVHLLLLWQIRFSAPEPISDREDLLEVLLVPNPDRNDPKRADHLAQANQQGGGDLTLRARADAPPSQWAPPRPPADADRPVPDPAAVAPSSAPAPAQPPITDLQWTPPASSEHQRHKYISAATREHVAAAYMDAWRRQVERVGNFHYPEEARRKGIYGSLILDVALRPNGSILDVRVIRSSGRPELDDAATRIVRLAAPYPPFPTELRAETDVLHITRTWRFHPGQRLTSH